MKTAVITGGLGFVGQRLCEKLLKEGYKVRIFSRGTYKGPKRENVEIVKVDYSNIAALRAKLEGVNVVFHLAACLFGYNYQDFYKANVGVSKNLCAAAQGVLGLESFVYLSSQAAAGPAKDKNHPIDESCQQLSKHLSPICTTDLGIKMLLSPVELKASFPIMRKFGDKVTDSKDWQL